MKNATTRELYAYWNALRGARPAPRRNEIDPIAMPRLLPEIVLLEQDERAEIVVRLAGTRLCEMFARELRGTNAADLWTPASRGEVDRMLRDVMAEAGAAVIAAAGRRDGRDALALEMVALPLTDGQGHRRFLIGALSITGARPLAALERIDRLEARGARLAWPSGLHDRGAFAALDATVGLIAPDARRVGHFVVYDGGLGGTAATSR
jgi:hypothetical protein